MVTFIGRLALPCAAVALVLGAGFDPSRAAAEATISVLDSGMAAEYRAAIDRLVSEIDRDVALAAQSTQDTPAMYLDLNGPLDRFPDFETLAAGDQALLRATKRTYELFRALGGDLLDRFAMLQRQNNRYYIAVDGEGGRWVTTVEEALAFLLEELVTVGEDQTAIGAAGSKCPYDFHCLLLATYMGMIESIATVPRDTTVTLELTDDGFGGDGGLPVLLAPDNMVIHDVTQDSGGTITATVSVNESAPLGMSVLSVYSEGHAFRSMAQFGIEIMASPAELAALTFDTAADGSSANQAQALAGTGAFQPLADDHSAVTASATLLSGTASGRLGSAGDADLFKIVVVETGVLSLTSEGPTDVKGTLETGEGSVIAVDDDGGARYNFSLDQPVVPGIYYLRVTHCCNGQGDYRLSSSITPN